MLSDVLGVVPQMLLALPIPGVTFGIYNSPIMLSVGFLVGFGVLALMVAASALVICLGLGLSPLVAVVIILLSFVTTIMSAQSVGQTGIDPMEIFGLIVLLIVAVISQTPPVRLFFVAALLHAVLDVRGLRPEARVRPLRP